VILTTAVPNGPKRLPSRLRRVVESATWLLRHWGSDGLRKPSSGPNVLTRLAAEFPRGKEPTDLED
jgi:hypothetical protein